MHSVAFFPREWADYLSKAPTQPEQKPVFYQRCSNSMCFKKWIEDEGETMKVDENKTYSTKRRMCLVSFCFYSWSQSFYMSSVYEFTVWFHIHIIDSNFYFKIILFTAHVCSLFLLVTLDVSDKTFISIRYHLAAVQWKTIWIKSQNPPLTTKVWLIIKVVIRTSQGYFFKQNFRIKIFHFFQVVQLA